MVHGKKFPMNVKRLAMNFFLGRISILFGRPTFYGIWYRYSTNDPEFNQEL